MPYAVQQVLVPNEGPLGLRLDSSTHTITGTAPNGMAARHGIVAGDVLIGINEHTITNFQYAPGPSADTLEVAEIAACMDAMAVISTCSADHFTLHILKPMGDSELQPPAATAGPAPPTAIRDAGAQQRGLMSGRLPTIKGQRPVAGQAEPPRQLSPPRQTSEQAAQALSHYPWATSFRDADGHTKNRYNMPNGTALSPLADLENTGNTQLDTIRRKEAFAATIRPGTSSYSHAINEVNGR